MKTIKLILATVMMMVAFTVQAQTVQVYKDGAVVKEYPASDVKDVQVKQVYYYYAGWECPTNEEELARLAVAPNGEEIKNLETMNIGTQIRLFDGELTHERGNYYIVVPSMVGLFDSEGLVRIEDTYTVVETTIVGYNIYTSRGSRIEGCILKKI